MQRFKIKFSCVTILQGGGGSNDFAIDFLDGSYNSFSQFFVHISHIGAADPSSPAGSCAVLHLCYCCCRPVIKHVVCLHCASWVLNIYRYKTVIFFHKYADRISCIVNTQFRSGVTDWLSFSARQTTSKSKGSAARLMWAERWVIRRTPHRCAVWRVCYGFCTTTCIGPMYLGESRGSSASWCLAASAVLDPFLLVGLWRRITERFRPGSQQFLVVSR